VSRFFLRFSKRADPVKLASLKQPNNLFARFCDAQRVTMGFKRHKSGFQSLFLKDQ
jgi:hypothetical protein